MDHTRYTRIIHCRPCYNVYILSCTKSSQSWESSTHDWTSVPDSYHSYCNSGKLLTTDICTRVSVRDSKIRLQNYTLCISRCLDCPHVAARVNASRSGGPRSGPAGARAPAEMVCAPAVPRRTKWAKIYRVNSKIKLSKLPQKNFGHWYIH